MEMTNITALKQLDVSNRDATIKVRIIKLWKLPSFKIKNAIHAIELILMDAEGYRIQATVGGNYLVKYGKLLQEKHCLIVKGFEIGDNLSSYRPTAHPHRLFFNFNTDVKKCDDFGGSMFGFFFTSFDVLRNRRIPVGSPVDITGYVDSWFPMTDHQFKNGKLTKKMNIQLRDLEYIPVYVTLWGDYALVMTKFLEKQSSDDTVFLILQFAKYTFHEGKVYVSTIFESSSLYLNEDIDELRDFQNRLLEKNSDPTSSTRPLGSSQHVVTVHDDFLGETEFKNIDEVNKMDVENNVIVLGIVISFPPGVVWYYNSCKDCRKKVSVVYLISDAKDGSDLSDDKQIIRCTNDICNEKGVSMIPRLKLQIRLQDTTGIVSLTLLDHVARKLLGKTAKELVDNFIDGKTDNLLPNEISNLVGKKMAFKIEISEFNLKHNYKSFTVKRCCDDPEVISGLERKLGIDHGEVSNSMSLTSGKFPINEVDKKDDTPMSLMDSTTCSSTMTAKKVDNMCGHSDLKRSLLDLYDHEESSSKAHVAIPLRNTRASKIKAHTELKRNLLEDYDREENTSKDPSHVNEGVKSLLILKKEK